MRRAPQPPHQRPSQRTRRARRLRPARFLRLGELKPVWQVPTDARARFRTVAQNYEGAVFRQTQLKQESKATFPHWGLFPTGTRLYSAAGRAAWLQQLPHPDLRAQLDLLYSAMDHAVQTSQPPQPGDDARA